MRLGSPPVFHYLILLSLGAEPLLPPKAAVLAAPADEVSATALSKALETAGVAVVDAFAQPPPSKPNETGAQLMKEARQAYDDLAYEDAATRWTKVLEYFTAHPETTDAKSMGEVHFSLATLAIQNGGKAQTKKAQSEFVRALGYNPELSCELQTYGKDVHKAFEKARLELSERAQGKLSIQSTPSGAMVTLRGRDLGLTPQETTLPIGRQVVRLSKAGFEPVGIWVEVSSEGTAVNPTLVASTGNVELKTAATALIAEGFGKQGALPAGTKRLAEAVQARFLVMAQASNAEVWDVESGNRQGALPLGTQVSDSAAKIRQFMLEPVKPILTTSLSPPVAKIEPVTPLYKKWWFWTVIGVVVVGGATAGVVAATSSSRPFDVVLGNP